MDKVILLTAIVGGVYFGYILYSRYKWDKKSTPKKTDDLYNFGKNIYQHHEKIAKTSKHEVQYKTDGFVQTPILRITNAHNHDIKVERQFFDNTQEYIVSFDGIMVKKGTTLPPKKYQKALGLIKMLDLEAYLR